MHPSIRRLAIPTVALGAAALVAAAPAQGSLSPISLTSADGGGTIELQSRPGMVNRSAVVVSNQGDRPRTVRLAVVGVGSGSSGGAAFGNRPDHGPSRWIRLEQTLVRLGPNASRTVALQADVPSNPGIGDRYAGVVAVDRAVAARAARSKAGVTNVVRHALGIRFRLPGPRRPDLVVTGAQRRRTAAGGSIRLGVANRGTALIDSTRVDLQVTESGRPVTAVHTSFGQIVPEADFAYAVRIPGLAEGTYRVTGTLRPEHGRPVEVDRRVTFTDKDAEELRKQAEAEGRVVLEAPRETPWLPIAAGLGLLAAVAALARRRRRRQQREFEASLARLQSALDDVTATQRPLPYDREPVADSV